MPNGPAVAIRAHFELCKEKLADSEEISRILRRVGLYYMREI